MEKIHIIEGKEKLLSFVKMNQQMLEQALKAHGAILLRGFKSYALSEFQSVSEIFCDKLFDYKYGSTPRTKLGGKVYTSTEYPNHKTIPLHNENSYTDKWPQKILFYCVIEPKIGGETPIANSHEVFKLIDEKIRKKFTEKNVLYTRNYGTGMDLNWQQAFQTDSQQEVEQFCNAHQIKYQWLSTDKLRTSQICHAILEHPIYKHEVWFNQAHLFHQSANDEELQLYFAETEPMALPRNAFFGDGTVINEKDLANIRQAYDKAEISFPWQQGDLLVLDNILYCHGRKPFEGERKIVVSMGE